jgi:hypothetical protein
MELVAVLDDAFSVVCPGGIFHFIHAFGNGRRSYASEPIAKSVE